jgi:hypothetical protein
MFKEEINELLSEHYEEVIQIIDTKYFDSQLEYITKLIVDFEKSQVFLD